jgi:hypothetical protein
MRSQASSPVRRIWVPQRMRPLGRGSSTSGNRKLCAGVYILRRSATAAKGSQGDARCNTEGVQFKVRGETAVDGPSLARELAALSALAALGCGLAAAQGDLFFVAIFGAASVVAIIEAVRRLR